MNDEQRIAQLEDYLEHGDPVDGQAADREAEREAGERW